jgi:hypothetical protein
VIFAGAGTGEDSWALPLPWVTLVPSTLEGKLAWPTASFRTMSMRWSVAGMKPAQEGADVCERRQERKSIPQRNVLELKLKPLKGGLSA